MEMNYFHLIKRKLLNALLIVPNLLRMTTIRRRLLFAFLVTSIFPVVFVGAFSIIKYENSLTAKLSNYSMQVLKEVTKNMNYKFGQYESISEDIIADDSLRDGLAQYDHMSDHQKFTYLSNLDKTVLEKIYSLKELKNIHIRLPDGRVFYDLRYENYNEKDIDRILAKAKQSGSNKYWDYIETKRGTQGLVLGRWIKSSENPEENIGYLIIVVDEPAFEKAVYGDVNLGAGSKLFLLNNEGHVVSSGASWFKKGADFPEKEALSSAFLKNYDTQTIEKNLFGERYLVSLSYISSTDWQFVSLIPFTYINSESHEVVRGILIVGILIMILSIGLSLLIFFSILNPLKKLLGVTEQVSQGNFKAIIDDHSRDEMGILSEGINKMVIRLESLLTGVKQEQKIKRQAELRMLQAQINPHFLFNTLNSFKWVAMLSKNKTLNDGLEALSVLLRNTIINKEYLVPIEEEVENLHHYATIQKVRYGDSFTLITDIEDHLKNYYILKFIFQPIVENSIIHATEEEAVKTEITLKMRESNGKLIVTIADNGPGFDIGLLEKPKGHHHKLSGIGIDNVNERIKIHYGFAYGLTIESEMDKGTTTTIILPVLSQRKGVSTDA